MEGYLQVPPERTAIIGRAVWKPRFIVFGTIQSRQPTPPKPSLPRSTSASKLHAARQGLKGSPAFQSADDLSRGDPDQLWLTVFKQKGDSEIISQNPISSIRSCEIQSIQFRKPGPSVATLIITFDVDVAADKIRKRRSSRSGQLTSPTSSFPNSLLFRSIPEERFSIYDWQVMIQPRIQPNSRDFSDAVSPDSASTFNSFVNPFANSSKNSDRPLISKPIPRPEPPYHRRSHTKDHNRDRPNTSTIISPSPSLRSRHSDLSSPSSSFTHPHGYSANLPIQQLPPDLPSPASTLGYEEQFISGWTSAQGRSSALSNHTRASNSVSMAGTPPAPRETILDRAFMLRYIPGSDRAATADEDSGKMSSIARFEALMREHEQRKHQSQSHSSRPMMDQRRKDSASGWELEEESESEGEESDGEPELAPVRRHDRQQQDYFDNTTPDDDENLSLSIHTISAPTQRALEYISGRNTPSADHRPSSSKSARQPPPMPSSHNFPPVPRRRTRPMSLSLAAMNSAPGTTISKPDADDGSNSQPPPNARPSASTSAKRLSYTEFAKRLSSSTSSLLLVQTNQSSGNSRASSRNSRRSVVSSDASFGFNEGDDTSGVLQRGLSQSRLSGMTQNWKPGMSERQAPVPLPRGVIDEDRRCTPGWRGSGLGVFGGEGGFL